MVSFFLCHCEKRKLRSNLKRARIIKSIIHSERSESAVKNLYILKLSHSQTLKLSNLNKKLFPAVHYIFFVFPEPDFLHQKKQKRMPFPSGLRKRFSVSNKVVASFFRILNHPVKNSSEFSPSLQRRGIQNLQHQASFTQAPKTLFVK